MSTLLEPLRGIHAPRRYYAIALGIASLLFAVSMASRREAGKSAAFSPSAAQKDAFDSETGGRAYAPANLKVQPSAFVQKQGIADSPATAPDNGPDAAAGRAIVRIATIEMIVQHPGEAADRITRLAEKFGGYLVSANGAGQNAAIANLTVRVPAAHFEEARSEIRNLGLRVENESFDAHDVTQQYVDQGATIRNLQAEEWQYLEILKQAHDMNSMLLVTDKLSMVRGKIEKEQAEFNSLGHQAETVAIAVSLKTEHEQRVFGFDWRPLDQLRVAASNGLENVANYATTMMTILFYLPAALLWVATIAGAVVGGKRTVVWAARRWFGWKIADTPAQG